MEPPVPPIKRSRWYFFGKPIVIVLSIILIFSTSFLIFAILMKEPQEYPFRYAPTGAFGMEYDSTTDTYRLIVISISEEVMELDEVSFRFINSDGELSHDLTAVLDNENSNIRFYDRDNDGIYSGGDEFQIDGDIVEPKASGLRVIWTYNGKSVMEYTFL